MSRTKTTANARTPGDSPKWVHVDQHCFNRVTNGLRLLGALKMRLNNHGHKPMKSMLSFCMPQKQKAARHLSVAAFVNFGSPSWARTSDLRINSPSLYRLSYQGIVSSFSDPRTRLFVVSGTSSVRKARHHSMTLPVVASSPTQVRGKNLTVNSVF